MYGSQINYRENYFQQPSLTKINGELTYTSLAKLEKNAKQQASPYDPPSMEATKDTLD
jgi:hypothetical protein